MRGWFLAFQVDTPRIETVWPTSVGGYVALALSVFALIGYAVTAWKASNRPIITKIEEAKTYFTDELGKIKAQFTEKIASQERHIDHSLDNYHRTVTNEINGWGARVNDHDDDIQRHEQALGDQAARLIRSEADREQLNRRVIELSVKIDKNTEETRELERSMTNAIMASERRILDAIAGRRNQK